MGKALRTALDAVGDRWSLLVVETLLEGPRRWSELDQAVPGIAPNVLADRLRRLEQAGVVSGAPYSTRPLRLVYELTPQGRELAGAVRLLAAWGAGGSGGDHPFHDLCGTAMEPRWFCGTCERPVDEREAGDLPVV